MFHGLEKLDLYISIHEAKWERRPNHYAYGVNDDYRGPDFEGAESYVADISEEGYATPAPVHKPAPAYHPAPVYKPAPVYPPAPVHNPLYHQTQVYKPAPIHNPSPYHR